MGERTKPLDVCVISRLGMDHAEFGIAKAEMQAGRPASHTLQSVVEIGLQTPVPKGGSTLRHFRQA